MGHRARLDWRKFSSSPGFFFVKPYLYNSRVYTKVVSVCTIGRALEIRGESPLCSVS